MKTDKLQIYKAWRIIDATAAQFGIATDVMLSRSRQAIHSRPRQVAMWLVRKRLALSYPQIAQIFGRTHVSILKGVRAVENEIDTNATTRVIAHMLLGGEM